MEYNTKKEAIKMRAYGRNVQNLIQKCIKEQDRALRQAQAVRIVETMALVSQQSLRNRENQVKLWNHLAILADYKLDITYPVELQSPHRP